MSYFTRKLSIFTATLSLTATTSAVFANKAQAISMSDVPEVNNYTQIYQLDIPDSSAFGASGTPSYTIDTSNGSASANGISRIGYYLELDTDWVWVSMDAFTQDLTKIGVPTQSSGAVWDITVTNMTVLSNVSGIVTGTGLTGKLEFWPNNYAVGANNVYDFNDLIGNLEGGGYGSMQIHNPVAQQTLLSYNAWGRTGGDNNTIDNVGIGNNTSLSGINTPNPGPHPDWTFANNANTYTTKNLEVFVQPAAVPFEFSPSVGIILGLGLFGVPLVKNKIKPLNKNKL